MVVKIFTRSNNLAVQGIGQVEAYFVPVVDILVFSTALMVRKRRLSSDGEHTGASDFAHSSSFLLHAIEAMDYSFTPLTVFMRRINTTQRIFGKLPARWASEEIAAKGGCKA